VNPFLHARVESPLAPLDSSDAELQAVVDKAWSRRRRWDAYQPIAALAARHHPDIGRLPDLLRAYVEQNLLQPFHDTTVRDPRLWSQLGVAADHLDFVEFIERYIATHPSTRSATELLFLLDELIQGNLDTLTILLDTNAGKDLWWTRYSSRSGYALIDRFQRYYAAECGRRGLSSAEAVAAHYAAVRLQVLNAVLSTTPGGYRAGDARFLIGVIHWKQGRRADALAVWRRISVDPSDSYATSYAEITNAFRTSDGAASDQVLVARIERVLAGERRRWLIFSAARLRQFGYGFDTF